MKIKFTEHKKLYKEVFGTEMGKQVLHDLCKRYHALSSHGPKTTNEMMRFREGERNVILYILHQCNYDIEKYINEQKHYQMEIEHG
jgi:hypothetical protein